MFLRDISLWIQVMSIHTGMLIIAKVLTLFVLNWIWSTKLNHKVKNCKDYSIVIITSKHSLLNIWNPKQAKQRGVRFWWEMINLRLNLAQVDNNACKMGTQLVALNNNFCPHCLSLPLLSKIVSLYVWTPLQSHKSPVVWEFPNGFFVRSNLWYSWLLNLKY